jgi:V8-like Glu-specific endopeptidase
MHRIVQDSGPRGRSAIAAALCAAVAAAALLPATARSAPVAVHVLDVGGGALAGPLRIPERRPLLRSSRAAGRDAAASSMRVDTAADTALRTNGKVLGVDPREGRYSCSGTALNTPSRSIVLTAGHCALEHGSAGRRIVFVPLFDHGSRPFGSFVATAVYVSRQWREGENPDFDVAALKVAPNDLGELTDVVGGRGYAISRSREAGFQVFGYPAAALHGEELRSCRAHGLGSDPLTFGFPGPPTMPTSCDMAAGASGGAWIIDGQYVNGVTSYSYVGRPTRLYSPYFGREVGAFLRQLP